MNDWPSQSIGAGGVYSIKCYDADGNLRWEENVHNLVTKQGIQDMNTKYFTAIGYTPANWYFGYIAASPTPTLSYDDTLASHSGWTESTKSRRSYPAASVSITSGAGTSYAAFYYYSLYFGSFFGTSIAGIFLTNVSSGTSGVLLSEALFSTTRTLYDDDTLNIEYKFYISAA